MRPDIDETNGVIFDDEDQSIRRTYASGITASKVAMKSVRAERSQ